MDFTIVVTFLTTIVSIAVKVVGLPDQIKSNYQRKSTVGLSSWFVMSAFISYVLWTVHGFQVHDNALIIGQGLGVVTTAIIVLQMYLYRDNHTKYTKISRYSFILLTNKIGKHVSKPGVWLLKSRHKAV